MFNPLKCALALAAVVAVGPAMAQITLYEHDNFGGRNFTAEIVVLVQGDLGHRGPHSDNRSQRQGTFQGIEHGICSLVMGW